MFHGNKTKCHPYAFMGLRMWTVKHTAIATISKSHLMMFHGDKIKKHPYTTLVFIYVDCETHCDCHYLSHLMMFHGDKIKKHPYTTLVFIYVDCETHCDCHYLSHLMMFHGDKIKKHPYTTLVFIYVDCVTHCHCHYYLKESPQGMGHFKHYAVLKIRKNIYMPDVQIICLSFAVNSDVCRSFIPNEIIFT